MAKAATKSKLKHQLHHRTMLEWVLFVLLLLLAIAFLISRTDWWFWPEDKNLGTAFSTSRKVAANPSAAATLGSAGSSGSSTTGTASRSNTSTTNSTSTTTSSTTANGSGSGGSGGNSGGGSSSSPLLDLSAGLNTGDSKQSVELRLNGLNGNCTVVANTPLVGQQQVCIYIQNGVTLTVTYLNDRVLSASLANL